MKRLFAALALACAASGVAWSEELLADPVAEARAQALMQELGCPVCGGQSIASSNAEVAVEMRRWVRRDIAQGLSDEGVLASMAARYNNEAVRLRPRLAAGGGLLWFAPIAILAIALLGAVLVIRSAARNTIPPNDAA